MSVCVASFCYIYKETVISLLVFLPLILCWECLPPSSFLRFSPSQFGLVAGLAKHRGSFPASHKLNQLRAWQRHIPRALLGTSVLHRQRADTASLRPHFSSCKCQDMRGQGRAAPQRKAVGNMAQVQALDVEDILERHGVRSIRAHAGAECIAGKAAQAGVLADSVDQARLQRMCPSVCIQRPPRPPLDTVSQSVSQLITPFPAT